MVKGIIFNRKLMKYSVETGQSELADQGVRGEMWQKEIMDW